MILDCPTWWLAELPKNKNKSSGFHHLQTWRCLVGWWEGCRDKLEEVWKLEVPKEMVAGCSCYLIHLPIQYNVLPTCIHTHRQPVAGISTLPSSKKLGFSLRVPRGYLVRGLPGFPPGHPTFGLKRPKMEPSLKGWTNRTPKPSHRLPY